MTLWLWRSCTSILQLDSSTDNLPFLWPCSARSNMTRAIQRLNYHEDTLTWSTRVVGIVGLTQTLLRGSFRSPEIRLTAPLLSDAHSRQQSAEDPRSAHFSNKLRRLRLWAKAQTLRTDMLTWNNRVLPQQWAAILDKTKPIAEGATGCVRPGEEITDKSSEENVAGFKGKV